jgi:hypothetical protein
VAVGLERRRVLYRRAGPGTTDYAVLQAGRSPHRVTGFDGAAVPTALDVVDGEVRELIRRRGVDPFGDPGSVRLLVGDVVADYAERSLTSALPPIGDPESVVRHVLDRVAGSGPLQRWLDDPEVEEIWVNEPMNVNAQVRGSIMALGPH